MVTIYAQVWYWVTCKGIMKNIAPLYFSHPISSFSTKSGLEGDQQTPNCSFDHLLIIFYIMIYFSTLTVVAENVLHFKAYDSQIQLVFCGNLPPSTTFLFLTPTILEIKSRRP